jgi:copper transport protein
VEALMSVRRATKFLLSGWALIAALACLQPAPADAHALLVRSLPEANSELAEAPQTIDMWFSEPLEGDFSTARVVDSTGAEVATGQAVPDAADPMHMSLPLGELAPGIYTVAWKTLSRVDGHEWYGSFPFTVLNADGSRPTGAAAEVADSQRSELPSPVETAARWLALFGMMLLFGVPLFLLVVLQDTANETASFSLAASVGKLARWLVCIAAVAVIAGSWLQIANQAVRLDEPSQIVALISGTRGGQIALARQVAAMIALALFLFLPGRRGQLAALLAAATGLLAFAVTSHAGAVPGSAWAVAVDAIHLLAAAAWIGGLTLLPFLAWQARRLPGAPDRERLPEVLLRFSYLASFSVFVLAVSGLFSSLVELPALSNLIDTAYGRVLLVKLVLVALTLEIAFFNRRVVHAQAQRLLGTKGVRAFQRMVTLEAAIALALTVVVAILVQTPAPRGLAQQDTAAVELPFNIIAQAGDVYIHLQITPNRAGHNRFWTHLYHPDGSPIGEVQLVRLLFDYQEMQLGQARVDLSPLGQDTFAAEGTFLSQPGQWDLSVYVRRRGMDDALADVIVTVPPPHTTTALLNPWQNPIPAVPASLLLALGALALGLIPFLWRKPLAAASGRFYRAFTLAGGALLIVGIGVGVGAAPILLAGDLTSRPVPSSPESIAAGAQLFQVQCSSCHGAEGMGDGPAAAALNPPPANMLIHVPLHTNRELYNFISKGFPGTAMPAYGSQLSPEEMWNLVNFLRDRFGGG